MIHLIKEIKEVSPFMLTLYYKSGELVLVDLEGKLREWSQTPDSKFRQLLDPDYFVTVKLDTEFASIFWDNGIDLCPDVLYELGKRMEKKIQEQPQAAFAT